MTFTEKLDILMKEHGLTRGTLAKATGIPYTTIVGFYERDSGSIRLSNIRKLAQWFGVSVEYLCDDSREPGDADGDVFAKKYAALSEKSRRIVDSVMEGLRDIEESPKKEEEEENITYIREYLTPAAAGYASPAEGDDYIVVPVTEKVPKGADYAVRIDGDSMEPYIMDGDRVYVARTTDLAPGDVGIFFVDGDMKCKQYCQDAFGNVYLFSLNRARADADTYIYHSSGITIYCFGKVLMDSRPPLPKGREI